MIPAGLERLVLSGVAESKSATLGGGGVSSFNIPAAYAVIVWSLHVQPFFDLNTAKMAEAANKNYQKAQRGVHNFQLSTTSQEFNIVYRSAYRFDSGLGAVTNPTAVTDGVLLPVYWRFDARQVETLVLRVTTLPNPSDNPVTSANVPDQEGASIYGYVLATTVATSFPGFGPAGLAWWPDRRRPVAGSMTYNPLPKGSTAAGTALLIPATTATPEVNFTYPIVNINYVIFPIDAIKV